MSERGIMQKFVKKTSGYWALSVLWLLFCCGMGQDAVAEQAMELKEIPGLYQRVLTLPGAALYREADLQSARLNEQPPALTPLYVYQKKQAGGKTWLRCGRKPVNGALGWLKQEDSELWKTQLVLRLIPRDERVRPNRVVFYKDWPTLNKLMSARKVKELASKDLQDAINHRQDPERIVAVEPEVMPESSSASPHFIPVLDYRKGHFRSHRIVAGDSLGFHVALLSLNRKESSEAENRVKTNSSQSFKDYKIGIVFLMDTTKSMGRYIDLTYKTIEKMYAKLKALNALDKVSFGLVGYRDHVDFNPGIEYVTKIYQPLNPTAKPETVLTNMLKVKPSEVSTEGFQEDMYAGLDVVVNQLDWQPYSGRFVILVTDASARTPGTSYSLLNKEKYRQLQFNIMNRKIKVIPMHIQTKAAEEDGDFIKGEQQFLDVENLEFLHDRGYQPAIPGDDSHAFDIAIDDFAETVADAVNESINGGLYQKSKDDKKKGGLSTLVANEIFKTQLQYLGRQKGVEVPPYFRGWLSRIDLLNPGNNKFVVEGCYLLSRNQLNDLSKRLEELLQNLEQYDAYDEETLRKKMMSIAVRYGGDPEAENLPETGILPPYLQHLPYQSKLMKLTADRWEGMGPSGQQDQIDRLKNFLSVYRMFHEDTENWIDLGEGDTGLQVYPVPLEWFP